MSNLLTSKAPAIQSIVARLVSDLGPDRVVICDDPSEDPESVTITRRSDPSRAMFISTAGMEEGCYTVSYDRLQTKRSGEAFIWQQTSSGVVYEGLHWIARKIFENGVVTGEFDSLPDKRRFADETERNFKPRRYEWRADGRVILEKIRHSRNARASLPAVTKDSLETLH